MGLFLNIELGLTIFGKWNKLFSDKYDVINSICLLRSYGKIVNVIKTRRE